MRLSKALQEKLMDIRLRDKLIDEGKVTNQQVKDFLDGLEDQKDNLTYTETESSKKSEVESSEVESSEVESDVEGNPEPTESQNV